MDRKFTRSLVKQVCRKCKDIVETELEGYSFYDLDRKKLKINLKPYKDMFHYVSAAEGEVSGLGKVEIEGKDVRVTEVLLFKQDSSYMFTTLDKDALSKFLLELAKKGKNPSEYRLWWHSHNDFDVMWSAVDEECIRSLAKGSMVVSMCMNKMGDMIARLDRGRRTEELSIVVVPTGDFSNKRKCYREVKRKVKKEVEVVSNVEVDRGTNEFYRKLGMLAYYD